MWSEHYNIQRGTRWGMTLHLVVMLHACCPGDYYRLMGYCNGRRDISSTVSFCCFSKHRETPLRGKQKIMARQWYPDLRLDGSWQVWTDSNVHTHKRSCGIDYIHKGGLGVCHLVVVFTINSVRRVCVWVSASWCTLDVFFIHVELSAAWGMISVISVKHSCLPQFFNALCAHPLEIMISVRPVTLTEVLNCECVYTHAHTWVLWVLAVRSVLHVIIRHLHLLLSPDAHQLLVVQVSNFLQNTTKGRVGGWGGVRTAKTNGWCMF